MAWPAAALTPLSGVSALDPVQLLSLLGAVMQLLAYALMQLGRLPSASYPYQLANVIGSLLMTIVATINREYGFILMEAVWCLTSAYGLIRLMRQPADATTAA
ncbi:MAG: hypothetical protein RLZZ611_1989 [Cyanobacteriota bacterium]|jgi:hypothetical protein